MVTIQAYKPFKLSYCNCGCGQLINIRKSDGRLKKYIKGHNSKLEHNNNWKGGRYEDSNGYILLRVINHYHSKTQNDGYIYEQYNKCCLLKSTDNRIENLRALPKSQHGQYHSVKYWNSKK